MPRPTRVRLLVDRPPVRQRLCAGLCVSATAATLPSGSPSTRSSAAGRAPRDRVGPRARCSSSRPSARAAATMYAVALADGDIVAGPRRVRRPASAPVAVFDGRLALPAEVRRSTGVRLSRHPRGRPSCGWSTVARWTLPVVGHAARSRPPRRPSRPPRTSSSWRRWTTRAPSARTTPSSSATSAPSAPTGPTSPTARSRASRVPTTVTHYDTALSDDRLRPRQRLLQRRAGG